MKKRGDTHANRNDKNVNSNHTKHNHYKNNRNNQLNNRAVAKWETKMQKEKKKRR